MTISATPLLSEVLGDSPIPEEKLFYFRVRLKQRLYSFLLSKFSELSQDKNFNKASLARRLGKRPEQITRWLRSPGNLELDTLSDLLLGMKKELLFNASSIELGMVTLEKELWTPKTKAEVSPLPATIPNDVARVEDQRSVYRQSPHIDQNKEALFSAIKKATAPTQEATRYKSRAFDYANPGGPSVEEVLTDVPLSMPGIDRKQSAAQAMEVSL